MFGSLIKYQCGETVVNGKGEMPEGIGGDTEDLPNGWTDSTPFRYTKSCRN